MRRDLINEDSNQFGPGTDLITCLLALLMVFVMIVAYLYGNEKKTVVSERANAARLGDQVNLCKRTIEDLRIEVEQQQKRGEFKHAGEFLMAGTFKQMPYHELENPAATEAEIESIAKQYESSSSEYPYIFVIGHANEAGIEGKPNLPYEELLRYNWGFAGVRSSVIANLLRNHLSEDAKNRIVIVSTGQLDLRRPDNPTAPENAFVEVFFGNEWKPEAYKTSTE
jgi:hypothetical protein